MEKRFIIMIGPSCSGKSSIIRKLMEMKPGMFAIPKSVTTRARRPGESDDEYQFVTEAEFQKLLDNGELLESAEYCGNYYGLSRKSVQDVQAQGKIPVRAMEINGVRAIVDGLMDDDDVDVRIVYVDRDDAKILSSLLDRDIPKEDKIRRILSLRAEVEFADECHLTVDNNGSLLWPVLSILAELGLSQVVDAAFVSQWDEQNEYASDCKVDLGTGKVFDIQSSGAAPDGILTQERVEIRIGKDEYDFEVEDTEDGYKIVFPMLAEYHEG